jgi:predicted nucleic acid-binding protein
MTDAVFDTTVFIDFYDGDSHARELFQRVRAGDLIAGYSPVTIYELWAGSLTRDDEVAFGMMFSVLTEMPLMRNIARQVGLWLRDLTRQQRLRFAADAMIAATADSVDATIYTRNPRDFLRFYPNVESY